MYCKRERFGLTVTSTDYDFILSPRQTRGYVSTLDGKPQIQERVTMIAASGTPRVSYDETEDEQR